MGETIEERLARLRTEEASALRAVDDANKWLKSVRENIAKLTPPFEHGDWAYVKQNGRSVRVWVQSCEWAFDEWVVKVEFADAKPGKSYYYPASALE